MEPGITTLDKGTANYGLCKSSLNLLRVSFRLLSHYMITTPYHFSIVACPYTSSDHAREREILYRGSIPAARNLPFVRRLGLRTIVYLRKKELKADDALLRWAKKCGVEMRWFKVEAMGEESLGMGKTEVGEVLKVSSKATSILMYLIEPSHQIILNPSAYPLYIADIDGISHTTLIIACLRKLQGWHHDSIVNEICRFEPGHEDLPLIPFLTSYLAASESTLQLPPPPYPSWLWPTSSSPPISSPISRTATRERTHTMPLLAINPLLPFPHPLTARKHPTMRLAFPPAPQAIQSPPLSSSINANALSRVSSRRDKALGEENQPLVPRISAGSSGMSDVDAESSEPGKMSRMVSFSRGPLSAGSTSPEKVSRQLTHSSRPVSEEDEEEEEAAILVEEPEEDPLEVEDEEDYDEEEEKEEEEVQSTSQYISALDLAGFG